MLFLSLILDKLSLTMILNLEPFGEQRFDENRPLQRELTYLTLETSLF
jgi:hypothetical protein